MKYELYNNDALKILKQLKNKNIKAVITDPPYGTTASHWDSVIDFEKMWGELYDIIDDNIPVVLFGSEPFSTHLRISNMKNFKYDWVWKKNTGSGFVLAKKQPLRNYEIISVFYKKQPTYNPQFEEYSDSVKQRHKNNPTCGYSKAKSDIYGGLVKQQTHRIEFARGKYPSNILEFKSVGNQNGQRLHQTQKPVELMEYLIKTYTNEGDVVLDFTMGSGSTGIACLNLNRYFIGIEKDPLIFDTAENRLKTHNPPLKIKEIDEEW